MLTKGMTKAELIKAIKQKVAKANPMVKRVFFRGLERETKIQLERKLHIGSHASRCIL